MHLFGYPDPSVISADERCSYAGISPEEFAFLDVEMMSPLLNKMAGAASTHHWHRVGPPSFAGHGVCAADGERWVNRLGDSFWSQQDKSGGFHPNEIGHQLMAQDIFESVEANLGDEPPPSEELPASRPAAQGRHADTGPAGDPGHEAHHRAGHGEGTDGHRDPGARRGEPACRCARRLKTSSP